MASEVESQKIDEVWIALPLRAEGRVKDVLHELRHSTVTVRYVPDVFGFRLLNHAAAEIGGMLVMDLSASPMVGLNRAIIALEDISLAVFILLLILPLLPLIALGVILMRKSSKGESHG